MTSSIETGSAILSPAQQESLACIAGHMIPASAELGMPAANDPTIFADMVSIVDFRDHAALAAVLDAVDLAAGASLVSLPSQDQAALLYRLRGERVGMFAIVENIVARAYYRDDRVLRSIGMEVRPPFPKGYDVEQGDWSLLDPVRQRGRIYREVD
jgi:hypothetical protein